MRAAEGFPTEFKHVAHELPGIKDGKRKPQQAPE